MVWLLVKVDPWKGHEPYRLKRFWYYTRESWDPEHRWVPYRGADEWFRRTIVLPVPFAGYLVVALWFFRDPRDFVAESQYRAAQADQYRWMDAHPDLELDSYPGPWPDDVMWGKNEAS